MVKGDPLIKQAKFMALDPLVKWFARGVGFFKWQYQYKAWDLGTRNV
jgi:hypothetical protein